jgi:hypothetical protein
MADDYSSFKQSLLKVDDQFPPEQETGSKETLEERRLRDSRSGLIFGNTRRLIPLYQKRFPDPAERQFAKLFAECMDDEYSRFYRIYREARAELDQSYFERFMEYWKSEGLNQVKPWAARSGVNVFNVYLSAVLKGNGRGVPVNEEQRVIFNVVAPLPETQDQTVTTLFVIMHETTHRLTDPIVEAIQPVQSDDLATIRENTVFHADLLYLKGRYPTLLSRYMKFFLNLPPEKQIESMLLKDQFHKAYPLSPAIQTRVGQLVKSLF